MNIVEYVTKHGVDHDRLLVSKGYDVRGRGVDLFVEKACEVIEANIPPPERVCVLVRGTPEYGDAIFTRRNDASIDVLDIREKVVGLMMQLEKPEDLTFLVWDVVRCAWNGRTFKRAKRSPSSQRPEIQVETVVVVQVMAYGVGDRLIVVGAEDAHKYPPEK